MPNDTTNWLVGLPDFLKLNPHLEWRKERKVSTLGGLLISVPGSRYGYRNSDERWGGHLGPFKAAMDHVIELYAPEYRRRVLLSQPNFKADYPDGRCRCGCVDRLAQMIDVVNQNHAASRVNDERLTITIHPTGAWYGYGGGPLIAVHSNAVPVNMPT